MRAVGEPMTLVDGLLEHSLVYRLWQRPFQERKFAPVLRGDDLAGASRVLDVACGPGTNVLHFAHADYVGVDLNERYIEHAKRATGRDFRVMDVTSAELSGERFDFILVNSFFHHVADDDARRILSHLATLLTEVGHVHILDLVLPPRRSIARGLARLDRGKFARPLERWRELFGDSFEPVLFEPYPLGVGGLTLWNMVYFKGKSRQPRA
jgi:SAM-dependent methyltransferase